jgi:hypothetical protein
MKAHRTLVRVRPAGCARRRQLGSVSRTTECVRCDDCERVYRDTQKRPHWIIAKRRAENVGGELRALPSRQQEHVDTDRASIEAPQYCKAGSTADGPDGARASPTGAGPRRSGRGAGRSCARRIRFSSIRYASASCRWSFHRPARAISNNRSAAMSTTAEVYPTD